MRKLVAMNLIQFWIIVLLSVVLLYNQVQQDKKIKQLAKTQVFMAYTDNFKNERAFTEWVKFEKEGKTKNLYNWAK